MLVSKQIIVGGIALAAMVAGYSAFVGYQADQLSQGFTGIVESTDYAATTALELSNSASETSTALSARVKGFDRIVSKSEATQDSLKKARDAYSSHTQRVSESIAAMRAANVMDEVQAHVEIDRLLNELEAANQGSASTINANLKKSASGANYLTKSIAVNSKSLVYIADQISSISGSINDLSTDSGEIQSSAANFSEQISTNNKVLLTGAIPLVVGIVFGATVLARRIATPLTRVSQFAANIASGDLETNIKLNTDRTDEFGTLNQAMVKMRLRIIEDLENLTKASEASARLQGALDVCSIPVSFIELSGETSYVNQSYPEFVEAYPELQSECLDEVIIEYGDIKTPMLDIDETTLIRLSSSSFNIKMMITPVKNLDGQRTGTIIEWIDNTSQTTMANELEGVISLASQGVMDRKIDKSKTRGYFTRLADQLNTFTQTVDENLSEMGDMVRALAQGDLSEAAEHEDFSGQFGNLHHDIKQTVQSLRSTVVGLMQDSETVSQSVSTIASGNMELSRRTEEQSGDLSSTAGSIQNLSNIVKDNAASIRSASGLSEEASKLAIDGGQVVDKTVEAMQNISEVSNQVAEFVSLIDDIAFQTNLLALNASVEAARAGEQGRGFSVVADEVRTLALKSADSSKHIRTLMDDTLNKVKAGSELANQSGEALQRIVERVEDVDKFISIIASSGEEQLQNIQVIDDALKRLDAAVDQNRDLAVSTKDSSETLRAQVDQMRNRVGFFKV